MSNIACVQAKVTRHPLYFRASYHSFLVPQLHRIFCYECHSFPFHFFCMFCILHIVMCDKNDFRLQVTIWMLFFICKIYQMYIYVSDFRSELSKASNILNNSSYLNLNKNWSRNLLTFIFFLRSPVKDSI